MATVGDNKIGEDTPKESGFIAAPNEAQAVNGQEAVETPEEVKRGSGINGVMAKLGLQPPILILMFKGSLPPLIGIALYQAAPVAAYFSTLGYLIPIISILAMAILPRGKFLQNLLLNVLAVASGGAVAMLVLWSSVQARTQTTPAGQSILTPTGAVTYSSSQSAVCAVWLLFNIWLASTARAALPGLNLAVVLYCIIVNVACTFGPLLPTVAAAETLIRELILAMLVALGLATGVSLLVVPISSRAVVLSEFKAGFGLVSAAVKAQKDYLIALETEDMFVAPKETEQNSSRNMPECGKEKGNDEKQDHTGEVSSKTKEPTAVTNLKDAVGKLRQLAGKVQGDMTFAKRDAAWGKLDAKDLSDLSHLFRAVTIPVIGLTTIVDIFSRVAERRGWAAAGENGNVSAVLADERQVRERHAWNEAMKRMHNPFENLSEIVDQGLEHAALCLEILPRPKDKKKSRHSLGMDIEARGDAIHPGDKGFAELIVAKIRVYKSSKDEVVQRWINELQHLSNIAEQEREGQADRDQAQLHVLLYMDQLMHATGEAVADLVAFADGKVCDGTMAKNRLIFPSQRRLRKWAASVFREESSNSANQSQTPDMPLETTAATGYNIVYIGDGYKKGMDPEHLPPTNAWERIGNRLRKISQFLGGEESAFGFRAACATMTVGIVAFLENTQVFFQEQRLVWAMIIIAIGMSMTSGQSIFGFFCRVGGTVLAMVFSLIIWYIVDENTPGVIAFLWFFILVEFYFFLKFPRFIAASIITIVTQVLIVGYELQVRAIGIDAATKSGQPYYPIYELAPYRVATVAAGSLVAFIWTVFPSPLTDRTWLRRDLSATLYLLANFSSAVKATVHTRLEQPGMMASGNDNAGLAAALDPTSPAHHLERARRRIFDKVMVLLPSMAQHAEWQRWEPIVGGAFPRAVYEEAITRATRITSYMSLMAYTLTRPAGRYGKKNCGSGRRDDEVDKDQWQAALKAMLAASAPTHQAILATLILLSHSLSSGQSLPPLPPIPRPFAALWFGPVGEQAAQDKKDAVRSVLDLTNLRRPGYAEFVVMQVCGALVCDDIAALVLAIEGLVGVVDFGIRVGKEEDAGKEEHRKGKVD